MQSTTPYLLEALAEKSSTAGILNILSAHLTNERGWGTLSTGSSTKVKKQIWGLRLRAFIALFAVIVPIGCSVHSTDPNRVRIEYSMDSGYVGINYKVTVLGSGRVRYEGYHGVGVPGVREYFVSPATVQAVVNVLDESPFFSMPETIPEVVFDCAMIRIRYSDAYRRKAVLDNCRSSVPKHHRGQSFSDVLRSKETEPGLWQVGKELEQLSGAERFIHSQLTDYALLMSEGWNVNIAGQQDWTALDYAVSYRDNLSVEFLLDHGATVSDETLTRASYSMKDMRLLRRIASAPEISQKGLSEALANSAWAANNAVCSFLLDAGANANGSAIFKKPIFGAAASASGACIDMLVKHGASVNDRDDQGRTPLIVAAEGLDSGIVTQLIRLGANIGARDRQGKTALTHALERCRYWTLLPLLDAGAAPSATDLQRLPMMDPGRCAPGNQKAARAATLLRAAVKQAH